MKNIFDFLKLKKNIVVLLGNKGIFLSAFLGDKILDKLFIPSEQQTDIYLYKSFLSKFPKSDIYFLLDNTECKMRHDQLPVLESIVKIDPIEQFITGYFEKEDIIAHCIYEIVAKPSEIWSLLIMSSPFKPPLSDIVSCVIENRLFNFKGMYFLALELQVIINKLVQNVENNKYANYFQICAFATQASGIKFFIKHKDNIITIKNFEYPFDKTASYIQGTIEQEINDCFILFKNYIINLNREVCIILIVDEELKSLLEPINFEGYRVIFVPVDNILNEQNLENTRLIDTNISKLLIKHRNFPASNNYLKSIKKLTIIRSLTFKLSAALLATLIITAGVIKYRTDINYKYTKSINEKYHATNQEYDNIKYKYPYIKNTTSLADLYVIEKLLEAPVPLPFELLKKLIITLNPSFKVKEIKWELTNIDNILLVSKRHLLIKLLLTYNTQGISLDESIKMLNDHVTSVKNKLPHLHIDYVIYKDKIIDISNKVEIPLFVSIIDAKT